MGGRLEGKVAIISGGARGIGAAEARLFAEQGASVLLCDVLDNEGQATAASIGDRAAYLHLDVTVDAHWSAAVQHCSDRFGPPTILVNNAAVIGTAAPVEELDVDSFRQVLEVNLVGTFLGTKSVIPAMSKAGGGSI